MSERAMRAKVKVMSVEPQGEAEKLTFNFPAKNGAYPSDGSDEDQQFARYSPSGSLSLTVANPNLIGKFKQGDTFYLDFIPAQA